MPRSQTEILKTQLQRLEAELNESNESKVELRQQRVTKENMSFTGGDGRLYVNPASDGYDISLSGKSLQKNMYQFMVSLCGKECDGFKQRNAKLGKNDQPYWRVRDFGLVKEAVSHYSKTRK